MFFFSSMFVRVKIPSNLYFRPWLEKGITIYWHIPEGVKVMLQVDKIVSLKLNRVNFNSIQIFNSSLSCTKALLLHTVIFSILNPSKSMTEGSVLNLPSVRLCFGT